MHKRMLLGLSLSTILIAALAAGPAAPPPPAEYDVIIRYRIDAARTERLVQFAEMTRYLESIGFKKAPSENENEPEDASAMEMTGTIASANVRKILAQRRVRTVMLFAKGTKPAVEGDKLVRVDVELASGLKPEIQQRLYDQTRAVLRDIGFQEAIGYDDRGHTRIVGNIAAKSLLNLLQDLRRTPAGAKMPDPFRSTNPVRLVEVLPSMDLVKPRPEQPAAPAGQEKISPDLRAVLAEKEEAAKPRRMEIILWLTPSVDDKRWPEDLRQAAPGLLIEGWLGPLVSVLARPDQVPALAELPMVTGIRLPRAARLQLESSGDSKDDTAEALRLSGLERLHKLGHKGGGTRIAIIDGDFQGWQEMVKKGRLPARTQLVDLTAERSRELLADPFAGSPTSLGHGTRCGLAAAKAAPEADLVLVRVDPAAPYQLQEAARYINGETFTSPSLSQRAQELAVEKELLAARHEQLQMDRRLLLEGSLPFEEFQLLWKVYLGRQDAFNIDQRAHDGRAHRFLDLRDALRGLKGVRAVASALVWNEGHPVDGSGPLSRYFDDRPFRSALWFQSAGDTAGQAWAGFFRDTNGNGAMEFVAPGTSLPAGSWTPELNFLGWKSGSAPVSKDLPAGAKVRVTLQWREAHDPDFMKNGQDIYQEPLAKLRIVVLRQRDPSGSKLPADDMEVVAQSEKLPQRLHNAASSATYEHAVEFSVPNAGRYAIMIQGEAPRSIRPANQPSVSIAQRVGELRPRIFVDTLSGKGRAVFTDFINEGGTSRREEGSLGTPADARAVITVGSMQDSNSAPGPAFNLELLRKPDVLVFDREGSERGTSLAASFAAGLAASALSAGAPRAKFVQTMQQQPSGVLIVPVDWPRGGK